MTVLCSHAPEVRADPEHNVFHATAQHSSPHVLWNAVRSGRLCKAHRGIVSADTPAGVSWWCQPGQLQVVRCFHCLVPIVSRGYRATRTSDATRAERHRGLQQLYRG
jgi:hypothetical protein